MDGHAGWGGTSRLACTMTAEVSMSERPTRQRPWWGHRAAWFAAGCGALVLAAGGYLVAAVASSSDGPTSVPSCSWPLRVRGPATTEQAGLVRCYLRALATHDQNGMLDVADTSEPVTITGAAFVHAADAQTGTATALFRPNDSDSAYFDVIVTFADGARADLSMELVNPASVHSWRMEIGTYPPDPSAPEPALTSP
jgi:hypothetical protein